ncbi:MAG: hypothetical protein COX39_00770 [Candidatus Nealsonbacteria bacterium CG23_combo_of_CG06-09_8_20_14_all_40_13]|uniref:Uncharacterized protein n=1 Tax=Candidatus Nealsonbacteria bacterium CG23_combo_of_CG06-09_8_20_14_all_40_13 TaxID=1974724 RepID=A0A2G9YRJ1_9BACT|nr:MAG: hypothetical protein COX39_00770 [Candidatus Nealsonbacteria bacterium CG23_combo_of_CG06-09_8_20_14_all_40_13]PIR70956.1 MAG: hypothetical protein COU44_02235 [Candidatus Nealsonbacteria bacterium CG10_big_fil_rev_8_21_14_0_10_40_24]PIU43288.1 MAG: hypothetical protein COS97_01815 [Candidatus Nealsonbacteria bacterium CG07_land_8_20_14_0_80_40_10]
MICDQQEMTKKRKKTISYQTTSKMVIEGWWNHNYIFAQSPTAIPSLEKLSGKAIKTERKINTFKRKRMD